jgi:acyl dehydratase
MEIGFELNPVVKKITEDNIFHFSSRLGGIFLYTLHTDKEITKRSGYDNLLMQGSQSLNYVSEMLFKTYRKHWLMNSSIEVSYIKPVLPGETLTAKGIITGKKSVQDEIELECEVWTESHSGERTMGGTALIRISDSLNF